MKLPQWRNFKFFQGSKEYHDSTNEQAMQAMPRRSSMPASSRAHANRPQPENEPTPVQPSFKFKAPDNPKHVFEGRTIQNRWTIGRALGEGAFGVVCASFDKETKQNCATKIDQRKKDGFSLLEAEYRIYLEIFGMETPTGFLRPIQFIKTDHSDFLVLPLLGKTLSEVYCQKGGKLSFQFICNVGTQMLTRLEHLHSKGFLHLDVKPENIMLGTGDNESVIYLIDFGLSKRYLDYQGEPKPYREGLNFRGTRTLASVHIHSGIERAPRDDIESLFYSLILLLKGKLPWTNNRGANVHETDALELEDKLLDIKRKHRLDLCNGMPKSFQLAWTIVSRMRYEAEPDYCRLSNLLSKASQEFQAEAGTPRRSA